MDETAIQYYIDQLADALNRIEYTLHLLHSVQNEWEHEPETGLYCFKGFVHPMIVKKHVTDLVREVWHLGDGVREFLNEKAKAGQINSSPDTDMDGGRGPGRQIVSVHIEKCRDIQICGDLANASKHYKLTHPSKTGGKPPTLGDSSLHIVTTGKFEMETKPDGTRIIKAEHPASFRPSMAVVAEDGTIIGDAVDIALKARDAWLALLKHCGCTFSPL